MGSSNTGSSIHFQESCLYCTKYVARFENSSESTPDDLIIKLPTPGEIGSEWQKIKELVASVLARGKERNDEWRKEVLAWWIGIICETMFKCRSHCPIRSQSGIT